VPGAAVGRSAPDRRPSAGATGAAEPFAPELTQGRWRRWRGADWFDRFVCVAFVVVLAVPALLLAAGVRPTNIENRKPAAFPGFNLRALADPGYYAAIDRFLADRLPLKTVATEAHAQLEQQVLGGTTNPDVVRGEGDWLFSRSEMQPPCRLTADQVLAAVDRAAAGLAATGRALRYVVAPDKHTIYPEQIAADSPFGTPCSDLQRGAMRTGMAARPGTTVDLWTPTLAARLEQPTMPHYYVQDSHWTPLGAVPGLRALVDSLAPGTWSDGEVRVEGTQRHTSDLSRLIGLPRVETVPRVVMRPGLKVEREVIKTPVHTTNAREIVWFTVRGNRSVVPGRTLFVYDSFYATVMPWIAPWFEESVWVHEADLHFHPDIAAALPAFQTVVFERAERSAYFTDVYAVLRSVIAARPRA
jgi:hypothetical protein